MSLSQNLESRATLWLHDVPHDLNTLVPSTSGLYLLLACGVNDKGQIIGLAADGSGLFHGYLATPRGIGDDHDASLDGAMKLSDSVREMLRKQLHFTRILPDSTKTTPQTTADS